MADATDVRLLLLDRDGSAGEARVATLPVTLGRDPDQVDVVVGERMVSRRHARLEADGDTVVVVDLGSANGTWIGDEQVDRRELVPGEVLTLGVASVLWSRVVPVAPTPELGRAWVVVVGERGLRTVLLSELYEVWARAARRVDALLAGTPAEMTAGLDTLADDHLAVLASWTVAACSPGTDPVAHRSGAPRSVGRGHTGSAVAEDHRALCRIAASLREGTLAFARHGPATIDAGGTTLLRAVRAALDALAGRDRRGAVPDPSATHAAAMS